MTKWWMDEALCKGQDQTYWFPEATTKEGLNSMNRGIVGKRKVRHAIATCNLCPVKDKCLEAAIENQEEGIWGGHWFRKTNRGTSQKRVYGL